MHDFSCPLCLGLFPTAPKTQTCTSTASQLLNLALQEEVFCDEFHLVDLRVYENCKKVVKGCDHVFNLAADMGGALPWQLPLY